MGVAYRQTIFRLRITQQDEAVQGNNEKPTGDSVHTLAQLHSTPATEASHLYHTYNNKILWTRKNTVSCTRLGLKHLLSHSPQMQCNGCTEQRPMMTAGKPATSHCSATSWQGWLLRMVQPKVSTDRLCFPQVKHSIQRSNSQCNGIWAGNASATCWTDWEG